MIKKQKSNLQEERTFFKPFHYPWAYEAWLKHEDVKMDKKMMQKAVNKHEGRLHKGAAMTKLSKGGMAPSKMGAVKTSSTRDGIASKGKTKGSMIKMSKGGKAC